MSMILCVCPNPSVDMFAWVDGIRAGGTNRILREARFPGGKGVHVAMALAELGQPAALLGFWGGATGQWIRKQCMDLGIVCHGPEVDGWSRTCITFRSEGAYHDTELRGSGPLIAAQDLDNFFNTYHELLGEARQVCFSGSWPQGVPPDAYAQMIVSAHRVGRFTLLDTAGEELRHALAHHPGLVHINRNEANEFFGDADVRDHARALSQRCGYAAVTAGAEGLFLGHGNHIVHARCSLDHNVHSAVGSGDCLLAGLAFAISRNLNLREIAVMGAACGTANCLREELGMLRRSDVESLMSRAIVSGADE